MAENLDKRIGRLAVASSEASVYLSSSEDFKDNCSACKSRSGHFVEAVGYCVQCVEHLCKSCVKYHIENRILKEHDVLPLNRITDVADIGGENKISTQHPTKHDKQTADLDNITFLKDVNVKCGSDTKDCLIYGIVVISEQLLAVADVNNKCVKVIDYRKDIVRDSIQLKGGPMSMTLLPQDQLAVTLIDIKCINILSTQHGLNVKTTIRLDGYCDGVVYFNGKLLVSFQQPLMFKIIDTTGKVIKQIVPGPDVTSVCSFPRHIALSQDERTIFISDWKNKICLSMDMNGKKIVEDKQLECPCGIVCSPQLPYIMVCDCDKHEIRKLTLDLQDDGILLNKSDDLLFPRALCFYPEQRLLLVSTGSVKPKYCNNVKIFKY